MIASSQGPRDALVATWTKFHRYWFGEHSDPIPVTEESLEKVSCSFKLGGYESFKNYICRIKECHEEAGFLWDASLRYLARRY